METCGKGHPFAEFGFTINSPGSPRGCRECRRLAAESRWGNADSQRVRGDVASRFWPKVDRRGPDECWPWTGARIPRSYGSLSSVDVEGRKPSQVGAHRVAFFLAHGHWPTIARHTCDNPPCVNPAHIVDGSVRDNARDMVERDRCPATQRTHCPQGHPYDEHNTWLSKLGHRKCRACMRASAARVARAKFEADPAAARAASAARQRAYKARKRAASD